MRSLAGTLLDEEATREFMRAESGEQVDAHLKRPTASKPRGWGQALGAGTAEGLQVGLLQAALLTSLVCAHLIRGRGWLSSAWVGWMQHNPVFTQRVAAAAAAAVRSPCAAAAERDRADSDAAPVSEDAELHTLLTAEMTRVHAHWADEALVKAVLHSVNFELDAAEAALADMQVATGGDAGVAVAAEQAATASGGGRGRGEQTDDVAASSTVERGELDALGDIYGMIRSDALKATRAWLHAVRRSAAAFGQHDDR